MSCTEQSDTEKVQVIGYSYLNDKPKKESINNIAVKHNISFKMPYEIDAIKLYPEESISNGYSGSPVICLSSNNVIGIVNIQVGNDTNYAICAKHLKQLYDFPESLPLHKTTSVLDSKKGLQTIVDNNNFVVMQSQLRKRLDSSLRSYSSQPIIWIEPVLHSRSEDTTENLDKDYETSLDELIDNPISCIIQARQQYGLSSIANNLILRAWEYKTPSFWLLLNANDLKPYSKEIEKHVFSILKENGLSLQDIECVVLDQFSNKIKKGSQLLSILSQYFKKTPLIIMLTIDDVPLLNESFNIPQNRDFTFFHLWALSRNKIRSLIKTYNDSQFIEEENKVIAKVVSDLSILNIPRTPLNCLTLLKISEVDFDDDPVNRTEVINRILFLLFNIDDIPRYKIKPDVKDVEFVLGYFCEKMIRNDFYTFTHSNFISEIRYFCKTNMIDLNVDLIFDVLYDNNIIINRGNEFCFRFSYWVFYFSAQRMRHSEEFLSFIINDKNYTSYPEIIEFYTGTDRKRNNVLKVLITDINSTCNQVITKCGFPRDFNLYDNYKWLPTEKQIENMSLEVSEGVKNSKLPDSIKDQYEDKSYDQRKPLDQSIHTILGEYSLLSLVRCIKAGSKALRNSDYASVDNKRELLNAIMKSWEQIVKVVLVLSPILAKNKFASLGGASFKLDGDFGSTPVERINQIIPLIPLNVVNWHSDDLFSKKMKSLLYCHFESEKTMLIKHMLCLLIISKRPIGWDKIVEEYIIDTDKNSFYLLDIYLRLKSEYTYAFVSDSTLSKIEYLIQKTGAKHEFGSKNPKKTLVKKIVNDARVSRSNDSIKN